MLRAFPVQADEQEKRAAAGALDPQGTARRRALAEILEKQRRMGLSKAAGTEDLLTGDFQEGGSGAGGFGDRGMRGRGRGRGGPWDGATGRGVRGGRGGGRFGGRGIAVEEGVGENSDVVMGESSVQESGYQRGGRSGGFRGRGGRGGGSWEGRGRRGGGGGNYSRGGGRNQQYEHYQGGRGGRGQGQQLQGGRGGYVPKPRGPGLLEKLLGSEIRKEASWLLQAVRFFVMNNFLQPVEGPAAAAAEGEGAVTEEVVAEAGAAGEAGPTQAAMEGGGVATAEDGEGGGAAALGDGEDAVAAGETIAGGSGDEKGGGNAAEPAGGRSGEAAAAAGEREEGVGVATAAREINPQEDAVVNGAAGLKAGEETAGAVPQETAAAMVEDVAVKEGYSLHGRKLVFPEECLAQPKKLEDVLRDGVEKGDGELLSEEGWQEEAQDEQNDAEAAESSEEGEEEDEDGEKQVEEEGEMDDEAE